MTRPLNSVRSRARLPLSWADGWAISCDFDGTITQGDVVQGLLDAFAHPSWRDIEAEWIAGRIGSRACLERQTRLIQVEPEPLAAWVDAHPVDPHAAGFFSDCAELELDVAVISDGYDWVIRRVMARLGFPHVPIFANRLLPQGSGRWSVEFPFAHAGCASGACKCARVATGRSRVHIGDGRSDVCVSNVCDLVFAKDSLLAARKARGLACVAFRDFSDVRAAFQSSEPPRPVPTSVSLSTEE